MTSVFTDYSFLIICWSIFWLYWFVSAFSAKKSIIKANWRLAILWRVIFIVFVILFVEFDRSSVVYGLSFFLKSLFSFQIIGDILTVVGLIVAIWARVHLGSNWAGYVTYKENHELVTSGPYRFVRHPIYSGLILMSLGTILCYGCLAFIIFFGAVLISFTWRIKREEKIMINLFGQKYIDYMKKTKTLIPWIW